MSKRYSRCRSAKLGALCPPMPVFKYAMLTPRSGNKRTRIRRRNTIVWLYTGLQGCREGETLNIAVVVAVQIQLCFSDNYPLLPIFTEGV